MARMLLKEGTFVTVSRCDPRIPDCTCFTCPENGETVVIREWNGYDQELNINVYLVSDVLGNISLLSDSEMEPVTEGG